MVPLDETVILGDQSCCCMLNYQLVPNRQLKIRKKGATSSQTIAMWLQLSNSSIAQYYTTILENFQSFSTLNVLKKP